MAAMQSWPTPNAQVSQDGESLETWLKRKEAMKAKGYNGNGCGTPLTIAVQLHGQAAPASGSSLGSRQELSEPSQRNWQTFAPGTNNRGMTPHRQVVKALVSGEKAQTQMLTVDQVFAEEIKGTNRQELWLTPRANEPDSDPNFAARNADRGAHCHGTLSSQAKEMWPTITAHTPDMESNGPNGHQGTYLAGAVKQWATPRSGKTTDENPETWALRQAKGDVATMPLGAQVKAWATPKASDPQHSGPNMRDSAGNYALPAQAVRENWLTPKVLSGGSQAVRTTEGGGLRKLEDQTQTPTGKLNPRWVETLMGLPIGWTMPSCTSPQTIAPTSCDCLAMELSRQPQSELSGFSLASCGNWTTPNQMDASIAKPALRPSRIATGRKTDYLARQVSMIQEP
jgi:hypothetical protein